jgi:hypothetical protein
MVKIDVEGAELMALRGMPDLIGRPETVFLIEVSDGKLRQNGSSADGLFDMMRRSGYSPFLPSYSPLSFKLQMRPLTRLSRPEKTYDVLFRRVADYSSHSLYEPGLSSGSTGSAASFTG